VLTPVVEDLAAAVSQPLLAPVTSVSISLAKTLACAALSRACRDRRGRWRSAVDLILIGRPRCRTNSAPLPELAGEPAGPICPRSGEARPDPASSIFFPPVIILFS
jgi:hypothetical protein